VSRSYTSTCRGQPVTPRGLSISEFTYYNIVIIKKQTNK
jgi:hypothetical protein